MYGGYVYSGQYSPWQRDTGKSRQAEYRRDAAAYGGKASSRGRKKKAVGPSSTPRPVTQDRSQTAGLLRPPSTPSRLRTNMSPRPCPSTPLGSPASNLSASRSPLSASSGSPISTHAETPASIDRRHTFNHAFGTATVRLKRQASEDSMGERIETMLRSSMPKIPLEQREPFHAYLSQLRERVLSPSAGNGQAIRLNELWVYLRVDKYPQIYAELQSLTVVKALVARPLADSSELSKA